MSRQDPNNHINKTHIFFFFFYQKRNSVKQSLMQFKLSNTMGRIDKVKKSYMHRWEIKSTFISLSICSIMLKM